MEINKNVVQSLSNTLSVIFVIGLLFLPMGIFGQATDILFSTDEDFFLPSIQPKDENLVQYSGGGFAISSLLPQGSLPPEVNVDALGKLGLNEAALSLDEDALVGGIGLVADEDILSFNGSNFTLWWDGSAAGLPPEVNLDALHINSVSPKNFHFSLKEDAFLPGIGLVADEDVIRYVEGIGFSMTLDGSSVGIPPEANVDAFAIVPNTGNFVLSLEGANFLGGNLYDDADLIEYNGSFFVFFDASLNGLPEEININAVEILPQTEVPFWMIITH